MTALLTDEEIKWAAEGFCPSLPDMPFAGERRDVQQSFRAGARFASSIYEARLAEDAKREALWRKLLNHLDEQVIDKLDADGSCSLCKELRAALGLKEIK